MPLAGSFRNNAHVAASLVDPWYIAAIVYTLGAVSDSLQLFVAGSGALAFASGNNCETCFVPPLRVVSTDGYQVANGATKLCMFSATGVGTKGAIANQCSTSATPQTTIHVRIVPNGVPTPATMTLTLKGYTVDGDSLPTPLTVPAGWSVTVNGHALTTAAPTTTITYAATFDVTANSVQSSTVKDIWTVEVVFN